jgi:hypothetical protein
MLQAGAGEIGPGSTDVGTVPADGGSGSHESVTTTLLYPDDDGTLWYIDSGGNQWFSPDNGQTWDVLLSGTGIAVFSNPALQSAATVMNDPLTYVSWFGGSALLGVGGLLAPDALAWVTDISYDPEVISNAADFVSSLDPNPAVPLTVTFGGMAGWIESGGADDLVNAILDTGQQMSNYVVQPLDQQ